MEFFQKLKALREGRGQTQSQAAEAIGITLRQYQRFERGEQKPGFDNLLRIADHFEVSVDWLMGRTELWEVWR